MSKLKTYSNRLGSGKLLNNLDSEDLADGYSKCDITEPEPTPASTKMKNIQDGENVPINTTLDPESPVNPSSAGKSRYGRAHKPKIAEDFLPTDKKVGAILGLSPKSKSSQSNGMLNLTNSKEFLPKGRRLFDNSHENDKIDQQVTTKSRRRVSLIEPVSEERINPQNTSTPKTNASFTSNNSTNVEECSVPNTEIITNPMSVLTLDTNMSDCNWIVGDLAWARVGRHPYWPCMIANDPELQIFMKTRILARSTSLILRFLHVQFFGDNGRHSWVSASSVFKFEGKASFFEEAKKILAQIKSKKGKKFHTAFSARESSKNKWESAVSEAEIFLLKQREERIKYFIDNFPLKLEDSDAETDEVGKSENEEVEKPRHSYKKRKRLDDDSDGKPSKQIKLEPVEQATPKRSPNKKTATPRSSTQNKKKTPVKKKPYSKRLGKDFELFTEKNLKKVSEEHPTWTKQEVEKFLVDTWADMDRNERAKYQVRLSSTPQISVSSSSEDDDDEEDDQSNDRDSSPARNVSTVSLIKKGGSLFRGTVREKVCQICLKPGNTVKCKGPCLGVFHVDCIRNDMVKKEVVVIGIKKGGQKSIGASKNISVSDANDGNTDVVKIKTEVLLEEEVITPEDEVTGITESDETETNKNEDVAAVLDTAESSFNTVETEEAQSHAIPEESSVQLPTAIEKTIEHCAKEEENKAKDDTNVEFRCKDCSEGRNPPCFVCGLENEPKLQSETRLRCVISHCGKFYHSECLKAWPQTLCGGGAPSRKQAAALNKGATTEQIFTCPQHVCHSCASDDPRNVTMRLQHERLVRCIQCPTAYHIGNFCLPAGSEILTGCQIICPRHYVPPRRGNYHVNAAWCSLCTKGGSLICCDLCPNSFHLDCLGIPPPEDGYICEDCDTGRFPLYGEVVWVKLGVYRWWPALILFPSQIPENIKNLPHRLGEFAIRFFGSHDHYWVNRGRVFFYQEGDSGLTYTRKSAVDDTFQRALAEAIEAHKTMKGEKAIRETEARQGMKPPSYVRIKSNKPVGNVRVVEDNPASMTPCDCDPKSENPCGPDSDCINRILMVECSPGVCAAEDRCRNQSFEKRQYPPLVPFKTESRGWGLKTLTDISKGDFVIEYVGELIDEAEYRQRLDRKHQKKDENYYFLTIDKDRMLDAGPKGNNARFMNHSCQPNCETQKWTVNGDTRVGLFALCDISEGSELTFNYNLECVGRDKKPCNCGAPNCSGFIGVKASKQTEEEKKLRVDQQSVKQNNKKKKKKLKMKKLEVPNNICYQCGEGEDGKLLFCDNKTCPKGYHMNCVELKQWPKDKWLCPWHRCNICKKRTIQRCNLCPNSFCMQHADGNIKVSAQGLICQKHDKVVPPAAKPKENQVNTPSKPDVSTKNLSFKSKDTKEKRPSVSERLKAKKAKFSKETVVSKEICVTDIKIEEDIANISTDTKKRVKELELSISERTLPTAKKINKLSDEIKIANVTIPQPRKRGRPLKNTHRILEDVKEIKATPKKTAAKKEAKSKTALEMELEEVALSFEEKVTDKKNKCKSSVNGLEPNRVSKRKRQPSIRIKEYFESNPTNNLESLKVKEPSTPNIIKTEEIVRGYKEDERSPKKRKTILQRIDHKIMSETGYRNIEEIPNLNLICHSSSSVEVRRSEDLKKGIDHNWLRPTDTKKHANENGETIEGSALENDKMNETAMEIGSVEGAEYALQPADANLELNENNVEDTPFDESLHNKTETNPLENITCINDRSDVTDTTFTSLNNKEISLQQDGINGIENNFNSKSLKTIDTSSALLLPVGS